MRCRAAQGRAKPPAMVGLLSMRNEGCCKPGNLRLTNRSGSLGLSIAQYIVTPWAGAKPPQVHWPVCRYKLRGYGPLPAPWNLHSMVHLALRHLLPAASQVRGAGGERPRRRPRAARRAAAHHHRHRLHGGAGAQGGAGSFNLGRHACRLMVPLPLTYGMAFPRCPNAPCPAPFPRLP